MCPWKHSPVQEDRAVGSRRNTRDRAVRVVYSVYRWRRVAVNGAGVGGDEPPASVLSYVRALRVAHVCGARLLVWFVATFHSVAIVSGYTWFGSKVHPLSSMHPAAADILSSTDACQCHANTLPCGTAVAGDWRRRAHALRAEPGADGVADEGGHRLCCAQDNIPQQVTTAFFHRSRLHWPTDECVAPSRRRRSRGRGLDWRNSLIASRDDGQLTSCILHPSLVYATGSVFVLVRSAIVA